MDNKEFGYIRQKMQKTQKEMAELLGASRKAVESYEQGWRNIPVSVERHVLFLLAIKMGAYERSAPCWKISRCTPEMKGACPAWEYKSGHLCWFINGTICQGKRQKSWKQKIALCRKCKVFPSFMSYSSLPSGSLPVGKRKKDAS